jgi:predicted amidohydrolase YtcJ
MKRMLGLLATCAIAAAATAAEPADLLLFNGKVLTVDKRFSIASAVAIRDGKVVAVGSDVLRRRFDAARAIDLGGRTLMPGFTDAHMHPLATSPRDVDAAAARSIPELQAMIRAKAAQLGPGEWITGYGWQESNFAEKRNLSRADLDAAAPNNPVTLTRAGGHSSVGNSAALRLANIDRTTPDPKSGVIEHGSDGAPNGIIRERNDLYRNLVPPARWEEMRQSYIDGLRRLFALGITSLFYANGSIDDEPVGQGGIANPGPALTFRRLQAIYGKEADTLPRVTMYLEYPGAERLKAYPHHTGYGDEHVRLGPIGEAFVDGGFTGPTAWLLADYKGQPGFRGKGRYTDAEYQALVDSCAALGWQMGVHAIGDAAIVQAVNVFAKSLATYPGIEHKGADRRWFLNHFSIMPPDATMAKMRAASIAIAQQPNFLYNLEDRYTATLDDWRLEHNNPVATPNKKFGLFVAFSSDNLPIGPMVGLYAAITRTGPSGKVHGREEAVSRQDAIRMYTANGPYLSWEEQAKGTIEPGKYADLIVLPFDPLTADPKTILDGKVDMTFLAGKLVYERGR